MCIAWVVVAVAMKRAETRNDPVTEKDVRSESVALRQDRHES